MNVKNKVRVSVIIPTYNGGDKLKALLESLAGNRTVNEIIIVDTRSDTDMQSMADRYGAKLLQVEKESFDHGLVRNIGGKAASGDILVYMTQDSMPADNLAIDNIIRPLLDDEKVAVSYGRQLPRLDASPFAAHLRAFNYPENGGLKTSADRDLLGIKTAFISNSFSAYRKKVLEEIGWFATGLLLGEDFHAGAVLIDKGYGIFYAADARVRHSHNYTTLQEFRRYFDIGVVHTKESWILKKYGKAEREGCKFVFSEIDYLLKNGKGLLIPFSLLRAFVKFAGYCLGRRYMLLPRWFVIHCTMGQNVNNGIYD
ncbi:MAG TPA: glycosyltransferase [Candidatus Goldiibacteriota bacterium]|nr:glycosyltransferase [Candidatus Goldiibacteriota bacterium]HRQ43716.1 glycosyltransferase [Candidatus Goldiibacteriota bacterium]